MNETIRPGTRFILRTAGESGLTVPRHFRLPSIVSGSLPRNRTGSRSPPCSRASRRLIAESSRKIPVRSPPAFVCSKPPRTVPVVTPASSTQASAMKDGPVKRQEPGIPFGRWVFPEGTRGRNAPLHPGYTGLPGPVYGRQSDSPFQPEKYPNINVIICI